MYNRCLVTSDYNFSVYPYSEYQLHGVPKPSDISYLVYPTLAGISYIVCKISSAIGYKIYSVTQNISYITKVLCNQDQLLSIFTLSGISYMEYPYPQILATQCPQNP